MATPNLVRFALTISVEDGYTVSDVKTLETQFASTIRQHDTVSLNAGVFTSLAVPSGAHLVAIFAPDLISVTIKGVTGDTGIASRPATLPIDLPIILPLGTSPSLGLLNSSGSAQTVEVLFL